MLYNSSKDRTKYASAEQVELHIHYGHIYAEKLRSARAIHLINEKDYPKPKQLAKDLARLSIMDDF